MPSCQNRKQSPIKANIEKKKKKKNSVAFKSLPLLRHKPILKSIHHNGRSLCFSFFMTILDYQANLMFLLG